MFPFVGGTILVLLVSLVAGQNFKGLQEIPDESMFVKNWKLLLSEKSCEAIEYHPTLSRTALACEETKLSLNCSDQAETAIVVCEALFGRDNLHECAPARTLDTNCLSLDAINVVTEACQWQPTCQVKASSHEFADPCPAQSKFLRVKYICLNKLYAASLITTTTTTTEASPSISTSTQKPVFCPQQENRGIYWPRTSAGKQAIMDCPALSSVGGGEAVGNAKKRRDVPFARFKCGADGQWRGRPDLSRCESEVGAEMKKIAEEVVGGSKPAAAAAKSLEEKTTSSKLSYGGDLMSTVEAIQKTANVSAGADAVAPVQEPTSVIQVAKSLARSGSNILADEQFPIWGDLPELKQDVAATRLLEGIEQSMMAEAEARRKVTTPSSPTTSTAGTPMIDVTDYFDDEDDTTATLHVEDNIIAEVSVVDVGRLQGKLAKDKTFPQQLKKQKLQQQQFGEARDVKIFIDDFESVVMPVSELQKYSENGLAKVVYIQYRNLERFMGYTAELPTFNDSFSNRPVAGADDDNDEETLDFPVVGQSRTHVLNSKIVTISMGDRRMKMHLDEPVIFTLRHEKIDESYQQPKCCFWDYDPWTYRGMWSAEGCYRIRTNATHTTCSCNHLTSFAILVDVMGQDKKAAERDRELLSLITTIGCSVSCFCLLLFWFTFQFIDRKLDTDQRTVHKHLAACLFFGELLFIVGIRHAAPFKVACNVVGGTLQFLFTSAFVWMLLEGVQIAIKLNELVPSSTRKWPIYYLAAYGTSSLLVGITAGVSGLEAFGNGQTCWLHGIWLLYFVIPVAIVITVNIFILSYLIHKACCLLRQSSDHIVCAAGKESKLYQTRSTIKGVTAATILLGLTWSFGFLYINQNFIFAAYLFTIFNSLQGFLIFLFFCVFNKWVRRQYAVWFRSRCCSGSEERRSSAATSKRGPEQELIITGSSGANNSSFSSSSRSSGCCFPSSKRDGSKNRGYYTPVTPIKRVATPSTNNNTSDLSTGCPTNLSTSSASHQSSSNQNIIVKMFKSRLVASPGQTKVGISPLPPFQSGPAATLPPQEKSSSPDLTPGKFTNQTQSSSPDLKTIVVVEGNCSPTAPPLMLLDQEPPSSSGLHSQQHQQHPTAAGLRTAKTPAGTVSSDANGRLVSNNNNNQAQVLVQAAATAPASSLQTATLLVRETHKQSSSSQPSSVLLKGSVSNKVYDNLLLANEATSFNTENVTDYMQQAFLTADEQPDAIGRELTDFDRKFAPPVEPLMDPTAVIGRNATIAVIEEDEDYTDERANLLISPTEKQQQDQQQRHVAAICSKSKTFSDFLSVLLKQHEDGLIDEETAQAHSRMFVSRIFQKPLPTHHAQPGQLNFSPYDDGGDTPASSSSSSLSLSQIPDIHGQLDDLNIHLSNSSLDKAGVGTYQQSSSFSHGARNDSGFCSTKTGHVSNGSHQTSTGQQSTSSHHQPIDFNKQFPIRRIDRARSDGDINKRDHANGSNGGNHHDDDDSKMFDDSDGDQLLLVDTSAPSHVKSLTFLPGDHHHNDDDF